jgi:hypothetical protein
MIKPFRIAAALLILGILSVALTACGSGGAKAVVTQDTNSETAAAVEATDPAEAAKVETAKQEESMAAETAQEDATANPEGSVSNADGPTTSDVASLEDSATLEINLPEEEIAATLLTSYADYGFSLKLDLGADVQVSGWTELEPSLTQGIIAFNYGGVNANIVWGPPEERTALTFLADTYNVLRASQPSVTFESISDGDLTISDQEGVYGGFKAVDATGASLGGGLIGAWLCGENETAFRMTLTGVDATVVQLRFDRLLENFACSSS